MKKINRYSPISPVSASVGLAVTAMASKYGPTNSFAAQLGTMTTGILGGFNLTDEELTIKDKFNEAMNKTWQQIFVDYNLSDDCLEELIQEVPGEDTSPNEFIENLNRRTLEQSYAMVIQTILERHKNEFSNYSEDTWNDEYTENASKDMASRLINTLKTVFDSDDLLKILKTIVNNSNVIRGNIKQSREEDKNEHEQLMQLLKLIIAKLDNNHVHTNVKTALNTIPNAEKDLIGREEYIKSIRNLLEQNDIVFIHAGGGVGKTAVAAKIVNMIKKEIDSKRSPYEHVAWITSTGNLERDLIGINTPSVINAQTIDRKIEEAKTFLQTTPTFLVIDNLDHDPTTPESKTLNTISGKTKILITTRANTRDFYESPLEDLDLDSALILFYRRYMEKLAPATIEQIKERKDHQYAKKIVEKAKHNALFIELIGCMAREDYWNLEDLWENLQKDVFSQDSKYPIHTKHGNDDTLLTQIKKLYEMSPLSECQKEIMTFIALFPAECSVFLKVFEWGEFEDDKKVNNLRVLENRGWIERDEEGYYIHTMVWGSIKLQQGKVTFDENRFENLIKKLSNTLEYMPNDLEYTRICKRFVVPETISGLLADSGSKKKNTAVLYNNIGAEYLKQGNIVEALNYCQKAIAIYEKELGEDYPETASSYCNIANVYLFQENYEEALKYYDEARIIFNRAAWENKINEARTYVNIAVLYRNQGNYAEAENYIRCILPFYVNVMGDENPDTLKAYSIMASVCSAQNKNDEAQEYFSKAKHIEEKRQSKDTSVAVLYCNQADSYYSIHDFDSALKLYEEAKDINEKLLGNTHPDTSRIYLKIAEVYRSLQDYKTAREYFRKAIPSYEKMEDKWGLATLYNNIAGTFNSEQKYEKSREYYEKEKEILEEKFGKDHLTIAETYQNIATTYHKQKNYIDAEKYYLKALKIYEDNIGENNPDIEHVYYNIALLYRDKGDQSETLRYYLMLTSCVEKRLGELHPSTAELYITITLLYEEQGNTKEALKYFEKACAVYDKENDADSLGKAKAYSKLAERYLNRKCYNEAVNYFNEALLIYKEKLGNDHLEVANIYSILGSVYGTIGEYKVAMDSFDRALEIYKKTENDVRAKEIEIILNDLRLKMKDE